MSALDEFVDEIRSTKVMEQIQNSLDQEPLRILGIICRSFRDNGQAVADYRLQLVGYISETALEALIAAGYVNQNSGGSVCIYSYEPTEKALEFYQSLEK